MFSLVVVTVQLLSLTLSAMLSKCIYNSTVQAVESPRNDWLFPVGRFCTCYSSFGSYPSCTVSDELTRAVQCEYQEDFLYLMTKNSSIFVLLLSCRVLTNIVAKCHEEQLDNCINSYVTVRPVLKCSCFCGEMG